MYTSAYYDRCTFYFTYRFLDEADEETLDKTIIHEWLHVSMRDLDQAVEAVEDDLAPAAREQWANRVDHEREGLIDRLAFTIYNMHAGRKPRFAP